MAELKESVNEWLLVLSGLIMEKNELYQERWQYINWLKTEFEMFKCKFGGEKKGEETKTDGFVTREEFEVLKAELKELTSVKKCLGAVEVQTKMDDIWESILVHDSRMTRLEEKMKKLGARREQDLKELEKVRNVQKKQAKFEKVCKDLKKNLNEVKIVESSVLKLYEESQQILGKGKEKVGVFEEVFAAEEEEEEEQQPGPIGYFPPNEEGTEEWSDEQSAPTVEETMPVLHPEGTQKKKAKLSCHGHDTERSSSSSQYYCKCGRNFKRVSALRSHIQNQQNMDAQCIQWDQHFGTNTASRRGAGRPKGSKSKRRAFPRQPPPDGTAPPGNGYVQNHAHVPGTSNPLLCTCGKTYFSMGGLEYHLKGAVRSARGKRYAFSRSHHKFIYRKAVPKRAGQLATPSSVVTTAAVGLPPGVPPTTESSETSTAIDLPRTVSTSGLLQLEPFNKESNFYEIATSASCTIMCCQGTAQYPFHFYFEMVTNGYTEPTHFKSSFYRKIQEVWVSLVVKTELDRSFVMDVEVDQLDEKGGLAQKLVKLLTMKFIPGRTVRVVKEKFLLLAQNIWLEGLESNEELQSPVETLVKCQNGAKLSINCKFTEVTK